MFLFLKTKLFAIGAIALTVLGFFLRLKVVTNQRDTFKKKAKKAEKQIQFKKEVEELDDDIEQTFSDLKREADKEIKSGEIPSHLRNRR